MLTRIAQRIPFGVLLFAVLVPLFALGLSNHGLWTADEPRVAEIGREMALSGNWAVPTLNQKPFLEKPPLYFWALASTFKVFGGASDKVARIPSAVFGFAGAVVVFLLARMFYTARVAFLSAFILATSFEYFRVAHWVLVDGALAFYVISAMTAFMAGYQAGKGKAKTLYYMLFYVLCGLAFLSKGVIGLVFPGLGVLVFLLFERNLKEIWKMHPWFGVVVLIALFLPWLLALWQQGGSEFLGVFLVENHLQRFLSGGSSGHHRPLHYYLTQFPGSFLPWSLLLVPVLYWAFSKRVEPLAANTKSGLLFMKCWFVSGIVFLSLASTKRGIYLLPILAPISILTAAWIDTSLESERSSKVGWIFLWLFGLVIFGVGLAVSPLNYYLSRQFSVPSMSHAIATIALSAGSIWFLHQKRMGQFCISAHGALLSVLLFLLVWVTPSIDRYKSFVPFCRQVEEVLGTGARLYAYMPDETLRGVVPFYTGRYLKEVEDKRVLRRVLKMEDQAFVVAMDKRGRLEKEILSMEGVSLLIRQEVGGGRVCLLFTNRRIDARTS